LEFYNQAFEVLMDEASAHSSAKPNTHRDEFTKKGEKVYTVLPKYFDETKTYLKKDNTAYIILKNMAVIYNEIGDKKQAINALEQSIDLAPEGGDSSDAINGLNILKQ